LMYAFAGHVSSMGSAETGITHYFPGTPDYGAPQQWSTFRRITPGFNATTGAREFLGESFINCKPISLTFSANPANVLGMRVGMEGLKLGAFTDNPDWADVAVYEDFAGIPITTKGAFYLPDGNEIDLMSNVNIQMTLNTDPQRDLVIGQYGPHDITMLSRSIRLTANYMWRNPTLYKKLYYNAGGTDWNPVTYNGDGACRIEFETPDNLPTRTYPAKIGFYGQRMTWTAQPLGLRGGEIISMQLTGVIAAASAGIDWQMYLVNDKAAYDWYNPT
jgi:hypothetical protein